MFAEGLGMFVFRRVVRVCTALAEVAPMTSWEKPSFQEIAMNAEIGAYQGEEWEGDRYEAPFVHRATSAPPPPAPGQDG